MMLKLITESDLRNRTTSTKVYNYEKLFTERRFKTINEAKSSGKTTIFVSHSHADKDLFKDILDMIYEEIKDVNVYFDWLDKEMPEKTSGATAARLKEKIQKSDKFLLFASSRAIKSNWVNWEIGYGDAFKFPKHLALVPVQATDNSWENAEYLQLYSHILFDETLSSYYPYKKNKLIVRHADNTTESLSSWLTKR